MATQDQIDFILGPQAPVTDSWFDQTQIAMAKKLGAMCPAIPPTDPTALNEYVLHLQYYDLPASEYIVYRKTGDIQFRDYARNAADSWWKHPQWIGEGKIKLWETQGSATPAPRHAGIGGFMLRAIDGRPELWDWIVGYVRWNFDIWLKSRIDYPKLHVGVREGAFMLHYGVWLSQLLPDSYPNAAQIRSQFLADVENVAVNYFGRLQYPDGSWRWDDVDGTDQDGGTFVGITQPFMIGLLLHALIDVHQVVSNSASKENIKNQIVKGCRHLYVDGPYRKDDPTPYDPTKRWRCFWYLYHGGTSVNPTKFEKGGWSLPGVNANEISDARQGNSTVVSAFAYAYKLSGDPFFLEAGNELWDASYNGSDGIRNLMNTDGKGFNQNCRRSGSYPVWAGGVPQSVPMPAPIPAPAPAPATTDSLPLVTVTSPSNGVSVSGKVVVTANATDSVGIDSVYLMVDSTVVGSASSAPYSFTLDTLKLGDGNHSLVVRAWNKAGKAGDSSKVVITVMNATAPVTTPTTPPATRKVAWPKTEAGQEIVLNSQWTERYRLKTTKVMGDWAIFEKAG